jgi:hypothetical protein
MATPSPTAQILTATTFAFSIVRSPFGVGKKSNARQGEMRLGRTPCSIPLQGNFFTPEASVSKQ